MSRHMKWDNHQVFRVIVTHGYPENDYVWTTVHGPYGTLDAAKRALRWERNGGFRFVVESHIEVAEIKWEKVNDGR